MDLLIDLQESKGRIWRPGDVVTGVVYFMTRTSVDVEKLVLSLQGVAKVGVVDRYGKQTTGAVTLFSETVVLLRGPYTIATPQEYSFELTLPVTCDAKTVPKIRTIKDGLSDAERSLFNTDHTQPLPPSTPPEKVSLGDHFCEVSYRLRAEINRKSSWADRDVTRSLPIQVLPVGVSQYLSATFTEHFTSRPFGTPPEDMKAKSRDVPFRERFKTAFSSIPMQTITYKFCTAFPNIGIWGEVPSIFLRLHSATNHREDAPDGVRVMELKAVKIYICRRATILHQSIRALGNEYDRIMTLKQEIEIVDWTGSFAISAEPLDLRTLGRPIAANWRFTAPNFSTFNIHMQHALKIKMTVEAATRKQTFEINGGSYQLLSPFIELPPPTYTLEQQLPAHTEKPNPNR